jgi:hypothetical protein
VLAAAPRHRHSVSALSRVLESVQTGYRPYIYAVHDGVMMAGDRSLSALAEEERATLYVCAFGLRKRGLPPPPSAIQAGLGSLADVVRHTGFWMSATALQAPPSQPPSEPVPPHALAIEIRSDPRHDPAAVEAIRIAAGLGVWGDPMVSVRFTGHASRLLTESPDSLVDGADLPGYWILLRDCAIPLETDRAVMLLPEIAAIFGRSSLTASPDFVSPARVLIL